MVAAPIGYSALLGIGLFPIWFNALLFQKVFRHLSQPFIPKILECTNGCIVNRFSPSTDGAEVSSLRLFAQRFVCCPFRIKELAKQGMLLTMSAPRDLKKSLRCCGNSASLSCVVRRGDSYFELRVLILLINPINIATFFIQVGALRMGVVIIDITIECRAEQSTVDG